MPRPRIDLTGQTFGRLTVYEEWYNSYIKKWIVFCVCDCGNTIDVRKSDLKSGKTHSCGCLQRERVKEKNTKHGECTNGKDSKEYKALRHIIQRCYNPNHKFFSYYGGRGIKVCDRWRYSFENFLEDMERAPSSRHSIDRIDNNGDYCPENCKWVTSKEQANNRRNNKYFEYEGNVQNFTQWKKELKVSYIFIYNRLENGIPFSEIVRQAREYRLVKHWREDLRQSDFENGY